MRKVLAVVVMAVFTLVAAGDAALAHSVKFERFVDAEATGAARIDGTIKSADKCAVGRPVDLVDENGNGAVVDTEWTDIDREFTFEGMANGVYRAVARKVVIKKKNGHKHVCPATSNDTGILIG